MKKLVIVFIFFILFSQFAFSGDIDVSSFIGAYIGYNHINNTWYRYDYYPYSSDPGGASTQFYNKFNNLMFGISTRNGLSNKISDDLTLYFLSLLDLGLYINLTQEYTSGFSILNQQIGEIIFGGEIKARYKDYFFGLGSGMGLVGNLFLRPSFGYVIKPNLLLDTFVDIQLINFSDERDTSFRLGFTFSIFK